MDKIEEFRYIIFNKQLLTDTKTISCFENVEKNLQGYVQEFAIPDLPDLLTVRQCGACNYRYYYIIFFSCKKHQTIVLLRPIRGWAWSKANLTKKLAIIVLQKLRRLLYFTKNFNKKVSEYFLSTFP